MSFDLLTTVEEGGCSAKLPPQQLEQLLSGIGNKSHPDLLVGAETHDDASVWKISDDVAIIQTTDFFPPLCSDPYEFGEIAATNALSDVFAMGGRPISALNLVMFPSSKIEMSVLRSILEAGAAKTEEAGAILTGGHTIDDNTPKYGLAVTGIVHPEKIISNAQAKDGDVLILTKPIGTGVIIAGHRLEEIDQHKYQVALDSMKTLNNTACEVMQKFDIKCATDITGFGLAGHAYKMAKASNVSIELDTKTTPLFEGVYELLDMGCIPGASFRNYSYIENELLVENVDYNLKMAMFDAQTSGGILMCVPKDQADIVIKELKAKGLNHSSTIGRVVSAQTRRLIIR
jgi:selenide,water dikinase